MHGFVSKTHFKEIFDVFLGKRLSSVNEMLIWFRAGQTARLLFTGEMLISLFAAGSDGFQIFFT